VYLGRLGHLHLDDGRADVHHHGDAR